MSSKPTATVPPSSGSPPAALPPSDKLAAAAITDPTIPANNNELDHSGSNYDKSNGRRVRKVPKKVENWDEDE
jgi:hypothetical protein